MYTFYYPRTDGSVYFYFNHTSSGSINFENLDEVRYVIDELTKMTYQLERNYFGRKSN